MAAHEPSAVQIARGPSSDQKGRKPRWIPFETSPFEGRPGASRTDETASCFGFGSGWSSVCADGAANVDGTRARIKAKRASHIADDDGVKIGFVGFNVVVGERPIDKWQRLLILVAAAGCCRSSRCVRRLAEEGGLDRGREHDGRKDGVVDGWPRRWRSAARRPWQKEDKKEKAAEENSSSKKSARVEVFGLDPISRRRPSTVQYRLGRPLLRIRGELLRASRERAGSLDLVATPPHPPFDELTEAARHVARAPSSRGQHPIELKHAGALAQKRGKVQLNELSDVERVTRLWATTEEAPASESPYAKTEEEYAIVGSKSNKRDRRRSGVVERSSRRVKPRVAKAGNQLAAGMSARGQGASCTGHATASYS